MEQRTPSSQSPTATLPKGRASIGKSSVFVLLAILAGLAALVWLGSTTIPPRELGRDAAPSEPIEVRAGQLAYPLVRVPRALDKAPVNPVQPSSPDPEPLAEASERHPPASGAAAPVGLASSRAQERSEPRLVATLAPDGGARRAVLRFAWEGTGRQLSFPLTGALPRNAEQLQGRDTYYRASCAPLLGAQSFTIEHVVLQASPSRLEQDPPSIAVFIGDELLFERTADAVFEGVLWSGSRTVENDAFEAVSIFVEELRTGRLTIEGRTTGP